MSSKKPATPVPEGDGRLLRLGNRLKTARLRNGLSLAQAAQRASLSIGFISLLENGKTDVTVGRLSRLLDIYSMHFSEILDSPTGPEQPETQGAFSIMRARSFESEGEGIVYNLFPEHAGWAPYHVAISPGGGGQHPSAHAGREVLFLTRGALALTLDGVQLEAKAGDAVEIAPNTEHQLRNESDEIAELFVLVDETAVSSG